MNDGMESLGAGPRRGRPLLSSWLGRIGIGLSVACGVAPPATGKSPRDNRTAIEVTGSSHPVIMAARKGTTAGPRREERRQRAEARRGIGRKPAGPGPARPERTTTSVARPPAAWKPSVVMSQQHTDACLVKMGDQFPAIQVAGLDGQQQPVVTNGTHYTLVVLWTSQQRYAREQYRRLPREVLPILPGPDRVRLVAIHVGDKAETVRQLTENSDPRIQNLWDRDGRAWHALAKDRLPRTYLLDPSGKVVWLDNEYSLSTVRELTNAVHFLLDPQPRSG